MLYKNQATTGSPAKVDLGAVSTGVANTNKRLLSDAEGTKKQAESLAVDAEKSFLQANKNLLSTAMRQVYQRNSRNPAGFNQESEQIYAEMAKKVPSEYHLDLRTEYELSVNPYVISVQDNANKYESRYREDTQRETIFNTTRDNNTIAPVAATNPQVYSDYKMKNRLNRVNAEARDSNGNYLMSDGVRAGLKDLDENPYYGANMEWVNANFAENPEEASKKLEYWRGNQSEVLGQGDITPEFLKKLINNTEALLNGELRSGWEQATTTLKSETMSANIVSGTSFDPKSGKKTTSGQIKNPKYNNMGKVMEMLDAYQDAYDKKLITYEEYSKGYTTWTEAKNLMTQEKSKLKPKETGGTFGFLYSTAEEKLTDKANDLFDDFVGDPVAIRDIKDRAYTKAYKTTKEQGFDMGASDSKSLKVTEDNLIKSTIEAIDGYGFNFYGFKKEDIRDIKTLKNIIRRNKVDKIRLDLDIKRKQ